MNILKEYDKDLDIRGLDEAFLDLTDFAFNNYISEEKEFESLIKEIKSVATPIALLSSNEEIGSSMYKYLTQL